MRINSVVLGDIVGHHLITYGQCLLASTSSTREEFSLEQPILKQRLKECYEKFPGKLLKGANSTEKIAICIFALFFWPADFSCDGWSLSIHLGLCGDFQNEACPWQWSRKIITLVTDSPIEPSLDFLLLGFLYIKERGKLSLIHYCTFFFNYMQSFLTGKIGYNK